VAIVIMIFLWHIPSATIRSHHSRGRDHFIHPMKMMGLTSNIMSLVGSRSLSGHGGRPSWLSSRPIEARRMERTGRKQDYHRVVIDAVKEVAGRVSLRYCHRSRLPAGADIGSEEGRLFKPLAYTKTFSMIIAAVLAITLDPAMRLLFTT